MQPQMIKTEIPPVQKPDLVDLLAQIQKEKDEFKDNPPKNKKDRKIEKRRINRKIKEFNDTVKNKAIGLL